MEAVGISERLLDAQRPKTVHLSYQCKYIATTNLIDDAARGLYISQMAVFPSLSAINV